ncbi:transketolase-like TK C-terminal-containing protein, partial [Rhizobium alvei]
LSAKGAYVLHENKDATVTIFASGSEVEIALKAKELLAAKSVAARVVSVPSFELFEEQSADYQASVLGTAKVRVAVEAGIRQGWDRFIGSDGLFVGMKGFGASGPYKELYKYFGITPEAVADAASAKLG